MIRSMIRSGLPLVVLADSPSADPALAAPPVSFHMSGDGVFNPANIGTPRGGNAGVVSATAPASRRTSPPGMTSSSTACLSASTGTSAPTRAGPPGHSTTE